MSRSPDKPVIEFDHLSARYAADPLSVYREMRSRCPVAWTDAHDGFWVTSTYADVFAASRDDHTFSSRNGVVIPSESGLHLLPIEVDPPELRAYRFTPGRRVDAPAPGSTARGGQPFGSQPSGREHPE